MDGEERSRANIIIHEIECGGFAEDELEEIIEVAGKALEELE